MTVAQGTPNELLWLMSHCRAIGMKRQSLSGMPEHDVALFTIELKDRAEKAERENAALSAQVVELQQLYNELIYGVARKCPDETRHQTALRYINNAETVHYGVAQANVPPSVKDSDDK